MTETVEILLATNNGERYLPGLLDSLLAQTYRQYRLVVRDDGSQNDTLEV
jgi:glycosyltransferase involved in cell wall biosynthesis